MAKFKQILIDGILTDIQLSDSGIFSCEYQKRYYQSTSLNALITKVKKSKLTIEKLEKVKFLIEIKVEVTTDKITWKVKDISDVLIDNPLYFTKKISKFGTQFYIGTEKEENCYIKNIAVTSFEKYLVSLRSVIQFTALPENKKIYFQGRTTTFIFTSSIVSKETICKYIDSIFSKEQELLNILNN